MHRIELGGKNSPQEDAEAATLDPAQVANDVQRAERESQARPQNHSFKQGEAIVSTKPVLFVASASAGWSLDPGKLDQPHATGEGGFLSPPDVVAQTPTSDPTQVAGLLKRFGKYHALTESKVIPFDFPSFNVLFNLANQLATSKEVPKQSDPLPATTPVTTTEAAPPEPAQPLEQHRPQLPSVMEAALAAVFAAGIFSNDELPNSFPATRVHRRDNNSRPKERQS